MKNEPNLQDGKYYWILSSPDCFRWEICRFVEHSFSNSPYFQGMGDYKLDVDEVYKIGDLIPDKKNEEL